VSSLRIRFAILLPLLALAVWYFLVPAQIGLTWLNLKLMARHSADGSARLPNLVVPPEHILSFAIISVGMRQTKTVTALNAPGIAIEALISIRVTGSDLWHPAALPVESWTSLCLPFFCLPAWWFAGRGLDSLLGWHRPRWWTLLIGTLLCAVFLVGLLAFTVGQSAQDRADDIQISWGFALWTLAFCVFPAAWIHRGFTQRRQRAQTIKVSV
jgi:hypothetical protein